MNIVKTKNNDYISQSHKKGKLLYLLLLLGLFGILLSGCQIEVEADANVTQYYYSFTDSLDNRVDLVAEPQRVVSLVGSYAETWILAGGELVGVTNDVMTERNLDLPENTGLVGTIKDPNIEEIIALSPDFVILSPDIENHYSISEILKKSEIPFAFFKVEHFEDYLNMLDICTDITGNKDLYEVHGLAIQEQIDKILSKIHNKKNPQILFIRAFSSGAKAKHDDNMACRILNELDTINIASKHKSLLEDLSIEEIIQEDPEYIFVVTMGDSQEALDALKDGIEKNPAWSELSAVKNDRYIVLPKELFHYKPNARWGESYEYIAKILYPDEFK